MTSTKAPPRRLSGPRRRQQILDVTAALVAAEGFHAVSIEAVARAAGISRPIVYEHFGDLQGLMDALMSQMLERALAQLTEVLPPTSTNADPVEGLVLALGGYLDVVRADPATWRLVLMPPEGAPPALRQAVTAGREAVVSHLAQALGSGLAGDDPSPDPELTAATLAAIGDESARLMLNDPRTWDRDRITAHARWFLEGRARRPRG